MSAERIRLLLRARTIGVFLSEKSEVSIGRRGSGSEGVRTSQLKVVEPVRLLIRARLNDF